jgi:hypothetical protein
VTANTYFLFIHPTYQRQNAGIHYREEALWGDLVANSRQNFSAVRQGPPPFAPETCNGGCNPDAGDFVVINNRDKQDECRKTTQHAHSISKRAFLAV